MTPKSDRYERYTPELSPRKEQNHTSNGNVADAEVVVPVQTVRDTEKVVSYVSAGLSNTHTTEVISSETEDEAPQMECDSDGIDVSVIEADMDLEDLMRQKELLQAEIAKASDDLEGVEISDHDPEKAADEVILLDDSSNDAVDQLKITKRKRSQSTERRVVIGMKSNKFEEKRKRTATNDHVPDRYKDRGRCRDNDRHRDADRHRSSTRERGTTIRRSQERSRSRRSVEIEMQRAKNHREGNLCRSKDRRLGARDSCRSRDRDVRRSRDKVREITRLGDSSRDRSNKRHNDYKNDKNRYHRDDNRGRDKRDKQHKSKQDKYKDSLSEGLPMQASSSDSDELDIDIDDEEDEQKIIEKRRKEREELVKV